MIIHPSDNVEIHDDGHKYARRAIARGEKIIKYGMPIGTAVTAIAHSSLRRSFIPVPPQASPEKSSESSCFSCGFSL